MLCNQAPLSREGANHAIPQPTFSLENFLNQYIQTNDSKFHTIQQTLQKAESHSFTPRAKSDKTLNAKELAFDSNIDSAGVISGKTSRTLDSSKKTSLNSYNTPTSITTPEPLADDSGENINANKTYAVCRSKAKTIDRKKVEQTQARPGRQSAMPSFWSPYRGKSPSGSNNILSHSFFSDQTNPPKSHLNHNNDNNDSNSDEEDRGDFLMIKPLTTTVVNPKFNQPLKTQNFNLNLEETLFPREIIDFADSLHEPNLGAYARSLIEFIHSFKDNNHFFSTKRPISEALYSMFFEGETLEMFKKLLHQVLEKLKEESITLKQKFRSEIEYIGTKHAKIFKSNVKSIKFEEKELQKLQSKIMSILQERCLMDSQSALSFLHHFLEKILEKFPSLLRPNALKLGKSVIIDHITLPKLLERFLEHANPSASFYKTIVIYTYDLYLTPQNFMLYLIQRYFEPEPLYMTASELRVYRAEILRHVKVHIIKLLTFWIQERSGDFLRNPDIAIMLSTFLDLITPLENEKTVVTALSALTAANDELSRDIVKYKQKVCNKVDQHVSPHSLSLHYSSSETSLVTKAISVSDGLQASLSKDDLTIMKTSAGPVLKKSPFANAAAANGLGLQKSGSAAGLLSKGSDAGISNSNSSRQTVVVSQTSSNQMFKFWSSFQCNKNHYDEKMLLEENSEEIAKHLTVIDWKYFSKINISEMIKKRWTKGDKAECPYYFKYVSRFNSFCSWIQYIILSQESFRRRTEIAEKFLEIGVICLKTYNNYSSSHYIFAAVSSLEKFGVISLQEPLSMNYEELKKTFIQQENFLSVYKDIFGAMKSPAIPNLNFFLQSFLKLQDGVVFWIKLPESSKHRYLKFPLLVQIQDSCKEMRRFQRGGFEHLRIVKSSPLYKFLKKGFKKDVPINLEDKDQALNSLARMVNQVKEKQSKLFNFFGVKANTNKGSIHS